MSKYKLIFYKLQKKTTWTCVNKYCGQRDPKTHIVIVRKNVGKYLCWYRSKMLISCKYCVDIMVENNEATIGVIELDNNFNGIKKIGDIKWKQYQSK